MNLFLLGETGNYVYFETSSPVTTGSQVTMLSKTYDQPYCMSFWYHMYSGSMSRSSDSMGRLEVKIDGGRSLFSKSGHQGDKWINQKLDISNNSSPYRVSGFPTNCFVVCKRSVGIYQTHLWLVQKHGVHGCVRCILRI